MSKQLSHENIINLLGREQADPQVAVFLHYLGVNWFDIHVTDQDIKNRSKEFSNLGISVNFEDIGQLKSIPDHTIGSGPYILEEISFFGYEQSFTGRSDFPIPGLSFESSIDEFVEKLGEPTRKPLEGTRPGAWMQDGYKIVVHWLDGPRRIRNITYWLTDLEAKLCKESHNTSTSSGP